MRPEPGSCGCFATRDSERLVQISTIDHATQPLPSAAEARSMLVPMVRDRMYFVVGHEKSPIDPDNHMRGEGVGHRALPVVQGSEHHDLVGAGNVLDDEFSRKPRMTNGYLGRPRRGLRRRTQLVGRLADEPPGSAASQP
jgi:hypothetical protein